MKEAPNPLTPALRSNSITRIPEQEGQSGQGGWIVPLYDKYSQPTRLPVDGAIRLANGERFQPLYKPCSRSRLSAVESRAVRG